MTEKEKDVIFNELLVLFQQTNVSMEHGLAIQKKASDIVFNEAKAVFGEECSPTNPKECRKLIEELQLRWRFIQTIYQDLKAIAEILNHSDLLPVLPEFDFCDDLWDFDRSDSFDDFFALTSKIDDFEQELSNLCLSWMEDVE